MIMMVMMHDDNKEVDNKWMRMKVTVKTSVSSNSAVQRMSSNISNALLPSTMPIIVLCENKSVCNNTLALHNQIDLLLHNALAIRSIALKSFFFVNLHFNNWQSKASVFMNLQYRRSQCSASRLLCWIARQWISLRCTSQPCPDHRTCIKFSALRIQPDCQLGFLKLPQWLLERLQAAVPAQNLACAHPSL